MSVEKQPDSRQPSDGFAWVAQFCTSSWCRAEQWFVRADARGRTLWQIADSPDSQPWSVAAEEPVCPLCGEPLLAHVEGVGDIEEEADQPNPFVVFLRTLDKAA